MNRFIKLNKLQKGDQVGVVSPSAGLPGLFPHVFELGLKRLREEFGLNPIEYSTTRKMGSSLEDRARDIMAAFADKKNKAVFASIGGDDQIKLIKFLDKDVFLKNPKPFFGYSDNTHLQNYLWQLGIPSYYGGAVMLQFAMNIKMHSFTKHYLELALFKSGEAELLASKEFTDKGLDWKDPENLNKPREMEKNEGWYWDGRQDAKGILWGGCLESIVYELMVNRYMPTSKDLKGKILFLETSEEMPDCEYVKRFMVSMGERELLKNFSALLVGRPKAWEFDKQKSTEEKIEYRKKQRETILSVFREYNSTSPVVMNMDFGHTDPQICLPVGRIVKLKAKEKKIFAEY